MPDYLVPKGGDQESTHRLRKFMIMMDSMNNAELDGKVDFSKKYDSNVESRIRRIAAGSGCHPNEVKMLLQVHKQFESMVGKMGKSGLIGKNALAKQQQMAAQMRKNPNLINQRINQMDPRVLQQMGGREHVMQMMQQMAKNPNGGGAGSPMMPPGMMPGMGGGLGGGMPNMEAMQAMMQNMGMGGMPGMGGGGGMPPGSGGFPGIPPGMDMQQLMKMAESFGGMGGLPPSGRR
jgi:Signal peptide binding domain